jgi:hypothetical protein
VISRLPVTAVSDTLASTGLTISYYDSAASAIPPAPIPYTVPGDTALRMIGTNYVPVSVQTVAVDTSKEYRNLKPPMNIPMSLAEMAVYAGIGLAVLALAYLGYRLWKRWKRKPGEKIVETVKRPAHVLALEELAAVKEKKLWQKGDVKGYYSELTEVVRRYFERRYEVNALEETTDEILDAVRPHLNADVLASVDGMLRSADLVKFAKQQPGVDEHERVMTTAYEIVNKTAAAATTGTAATGTGNVES